MVFRLPSTTLSTLVVTPEVVTMPVSPAPGAPGSLLVLACDGLWDVLAPSDVGATLRSNGHLDESRPMELQGAARCLADEAMARGSDDNVSVVVVAIV